MQQDKIYFPSCGTEWPKTVKTSESSDSEPEEEIQSRHNRPGVASWQVEATYADLGVRGERGGEERRGGRGEGGGRRRERGGGGFLSR